MIVSAKKKILFHRFFCFSKKVAVVLSGCGVYDGSEVHEAAACLAAITRHHAEPVVFAPKMNQVLAL